MRLATAEPLVGVTEPPAARCRPSAIRASRCRRCGVEPACASPDLRGSRSSAPSPTPSRGRAWTHSSAPAGGAQSAPHGLRSRHLQCLIDSRIELAGELRLPLHQGLLGCRSTHTTKNPPDASAYGTSCLQARTSRGRAVNARRAMGSVRRSLPELWHKPTPLGQSYLPAATLPETTCLNIENSCR